MAQLPVRSMNHGAVAETLVQALVARYGAISAYRDQGAVLRTIREGGAPMVTPFATLFRRPAEFKFTFSTPHPYPPLAHIVTRHCCGADSNGAYAWTKRHEEPASVVDEVDLSMAIAGATGISGGSAHTMGALLLPAIGGLGLNQIAGWRLLHREAFEGSACAVLGARRRGGELHLWVHEDTLTLRRLVAGTGSLHAAEEVHRDIEIDGPIDDAELQRPNAP